MHKDVGLALESAKDLGVPLPVTALTEQMLRANMASGRADDDFCSVIRVLEDWANVEVKK
jgi:3-hydroxyisobutyrate dehydrogenase-like beta-hydroxyacid dehydrogenase